MSTTPQIPEEARKNIPEGYDDWCEAHQLYYKDECQLCSCAFRKSIPEEVKQRIIHQSNSALPEAYRGARTAMDYIEGHRNGMALEYLRAQEDIAKLTEDGLHWNRLYVKTKNELVAAQEEIAELKTSYTLIKNDLDREREAVAELTKERDTFWWALEEIKRVHREYYLSGEIDNRMANHLYNIALENLLKIPCNPYAELQKRPQWVSDKLPEDSGLYLCEIEQQIPGGVARYKSEIEYMAGVKYFNRLASNERVIKWLLEETPLQQTNTHE